MRFAMGGGLRNFGLAMAWALAPGLAADPVSYSGKVVDGSGIAIPWAFIKVEGSNITAQSLADGSFTLAANVTQVFYADPRPRAPVFTAPVVEGSAPRFLLTGRTATGPHIASVLLLSVPGGGIPVARAHSLAQAARIADADSAAPTLPPASGSGGSRNPSPPPALAKAAGAYTLTVAMANYKSGSFSQATATARNLVLTLSPSSTDTARYAAEKKLCLDTINAYRAQVGLKAVTWSTSLEAFADQGARYDSERNSAHAHFGAFSRNAVPSDAENSIPGWPLSNFKTVASVVAKGAQMMWAEGPGGGHYENIKGSHTQVGCGIYVTPSGAVWVIHDFK